MSAAAAAAAFAEHWAEGGYRFGIINFANPDMVGHTGVIPAAVDGDRGGRPLPRRGRRGGARVAAAPASSPPTTATPSRCWSPTARPTPPTRPTRCPLIVTVPGRRACATAASSPTSPRRCWRCSGSRSRSAMTGKSLLAWLDPRLARAQRPGQAQLRDPGPRRRRPRRACSAPPTARSRRPPSSRWRPKATRALAVRGEVAELGYEMVLGNTFHLHPRAGRGADRRHRRPARVHGLGAGDHHRLRRLPGLLARPRRRRRRDQGAARARRRARREGRDLRARGCGSAPTRRLGALPRPGGARWGSRPTLGSDIALAFDECTPFHADRDYTARSTERTHRWLDRCLDWHEREGPARQAVFGIVQGGVHEDLRRESAEAVAAAAVDGIAIGGTLGRDKPEMHGVLGMTMPHAARRGAQAPARDRRGRRPARRASRSGSTSSTAPSRPASRATASPSPPSPRGASASTWSSAATPTTTRRWSKAAPARPARATAAPTSTTWRASNELTGARLLTLHNLTYMERLTSGAREAINEGGYAAYAEAILGGAAPWEARVQARPENGVPGRPQRG